MNIKLAWERVKYDIGKRHFLKYQFQLELINSDLSAWLEKQKIIFDAGSYIPNPILICDVPKGKGLIRPGAHLTIEDVLFYTALVAECYKPIYDKIRWSQNKTEFSYTMSENADRIDWFLNHFKGWENFRDKSLEKVEDGFSYVVFTDITGFYENIDIQLLLSDLRNCRISEEIIAQISKCLNKWAYINKGIPQGQSASDIFAKLYLNSVDLGLKNSDIIHLRYVDDIRIFCRTKADAKKALIELTNLLRKRGLNLQSAKTKILNSIEAKSEIESIFPIIHKVVAQLRKETIKIIEDPYGGEYEIFDPEATISEPSGRVIEETFRSYFSEAEESKFDKSLFHYLLNRLKQADNPFALDYSLSILESHPEETKYILEYSNYVSGIHDVVYGTKKRMIKKLIEFIASDNGIYDYQNYQIINWLYENSIEEDDVLLKITRNYAYDNNRPYYLQRTCRMFLGKFGNDSDIEKIYDQYFVASNEIEKADLICCLEKMERSRRNSFLGRVKDDGYLISLAVKKIKNVK